MVTAAQLEPEIAETQDFRREMGHVSRHSLVFFAGTVFTGAAGYVFKIYLARNLGAEALGVFTLGMTLIGFLGVFSCLGLPQAAVRFVASYSATRDFSLLRGFIVRGIVLLLACNLGFSGLLMLSGNWLAVHLYHTPGLGRYVGLFALIMTFAALNTFLAQVLAGFKHVAQRTVITSLIGTPLMMAAAVVLIAFGAQLRGYMVAQLGSAAVVLVLLVIACWKLMPSGSRVLRAPLAPLEREVSIFSATVFGMNLLEFVLAQSDKVLIGFYLNARQVGIYAIAAALVAFVPIILQSVNQIFSPTIAELHARGNYDLLERMYQTLTKWILGFTVPLAAMMILFAPTLMAMFGKEFEAGWPILVLGTIGQLVNCATGSVGYLLLMSGNQRRLIKIQSTMAVVMLVLSMVMIPAWGIVGAAAASATSIVLSNVCYLRDVRTSLRVFPYNASYLRLMLPAGATASVLLVLRWQMATLYPAWIVVGSALAAGYLTFAVVWLKFGLDADDRLIATTGWLRLRSLYLRMEANG